MLLLLGGTLPHTLTWIGCCCGYMTESFCQIKKIFFYFSLRIFIKTQCHNSKSWYHFFFQYINAMYHLKFFFLLYYSCLLRIFTTGSWCILFNTLATKFDLIQDACIYGHKQSRLILFFPYYLCFFLLCNMLHTWELHVTVYLEDLITFTHKNEIGGLKDGFLTAF